MKHAHVRNRLFQVVVAAAFAFVTNAAHAVFVSGNFDPPDLSGNLPQGLMLLIRRLLQKSRDDRYQSMAEVRGPGPADGQRA